MDASEKVLPVIPTEHALSSVILSGAASGNASREVERVSCARPSVISTEQREWRNLARQRISYERLVL